MLEFQCIVNKVVRICFVSFLCYFVVKKAVGTTNQHEITQKKKHKLFVKALFTEHC